VRGSILSRSYFEICCDILALDGLIRFAGIVSMEGRILAAQYREGLVPMLTPKESELSIMQSLMRMSIRKTLEEKIGKTIYATAVYQKVKRATIPMYSEGNKPDSILMVSLEREADLESTVQDMILPYVGRVGKALAE
jgi:hypothetical protein